MWLVICDPHDAAALWAARGLRARGLTPLELVAPMELACAERFELRIGGVGPAEAQATLASGLHLCSASVRGCLNRCTPLPHPMLLRLGPIDRDYLQAEWEAVLLAWLGAFDETSAIVNAAQPWALGGRAIHPLSWAGLAQRAGLDTPPARCGASGPEAPRPDLDDRLTTHLVMGGRTFPPAPKPCEAALQRLQQASGLRLLGATLAHRSAASPRFCGGDAMPDLRLGGEPFLDLLASELGR